MKHIDLLTYIEDIEDRFLPDGEKQFLIIVVDSLAKGQKVQVKKVDHDAAKDKQQQH